MKLIYICHTCGSETEKVIIHHILPRALGGKDLDTNIVKICGTCHGKIHGNTNIFASSLIKKRLGDLKNQGVLLGAHTKVNKETIEMFNELRNKGYTLREISKITNYSCGTIHKYTKFKQSEDNNEQRPD